MLFNEPLNSKKLDKNNKQLLELKTRSVNAIKGMQQSGKEEVLGNVDTKTEKSKVKSIQKILYNNI